MVPGMTERERRAVDARRREWLAESALQPVTTVRRANGETAARSRLSVPLGLWRRGVASALALGRRTRLVPRHNAESAGSAVKLEPR